MSDKIVTCETVKVTKNLGTYPYCFLGPDDKPMCTYETHEEECGLNLEGLSRDNPQLTELFRTARGTLSANVLSQIDALKKALVDDIVNHRDKSDDHNGCFDATDYRLSRSCRDPEGFARSIAEDKMADRRDVTRLFESLSADRRVAIHKTADRFYENATILIQRLKD
ncbi:MAG: hypothetical protein HY466_02105 [Deltaproteobacteria bacterium]|nr:hypothetical protein [Deltaproteobacteria bacterium]